MYSMKFQTPDELHKALTGQVIRLDGHPLTDSVVCMRCEQIVISALRSVPAAPQVWYSPTDVAYLVKAGDVMRLAHGLRSFGAEVMGAAAPLPDPSFRPGPASSPRSGPVRPDWCGRCDERTRLVEVEAQDAARFATLRRCPDCHPLRHERIGRRAIEEPVLAATDPDVYRRKVSELRDELHRLKLNRPVATDDDESIPF